MCDCQKVIAEKMKKLFPDAEISGQYELFSGRSYSDYSIKFHVSRRNPTKRKPKTVPVLHSYCPHCGEKYESEGKAKC